MEKIEPGQFVEMEDLVPTHLGFEESTGSKTKQRSVANIFEWLQAFAVYLAIIAKKQPHCMPDLKGYQILMLEASNEFQNNRWMAYDRRFRQHAATQPGCKWSAIDSTFWNFAFTGQARASHCRHCFSLFHHRKIANLLLLLLPVHMTRRRTKLPANVDLFVAGGMRNKLQAVPF